MNWIDIVIIVIMLIFIIIGVCKGFMFSVLSLFSGMVSVFLSILLTKPMTMLLSLTGVQNSISTGYVTKFAGLSSFQTNLVDIANPTEFAKNAVSSSNLSGFSKTVTNWFLNISPSQLEGKGSITLSEILSKAYAGFWCTLIAFAISFALIWLVLWILSRIAKKTKENKVVNKTDRFLGFIFGIVRGALVISVIFAVLSFFNRTGVFAPLFNYIEQSKIGSWLFNFVDHFMKTYINIDGIVKSIFK